MDCETPGERSVSLQSLTRETPPPVFLLIVMVIYGLGGADGGPLEIYLTVLLGRRQAVMTWANPSHPS